MSEGYYTVSDIWVYGEDDQASPFSDLLNLHAESVADYATRTNGRLFSLENQWSTLDGAQVLDTESGVGIEDARAVFLPGYIATVNIRLSSVAVSSGNQNVSIGTLTQALWPNAWYAPITGWHGSGALTALVHASSGTLSVRWSNTANDGVIMIAGSWPL